MPLARAIVLRTRRRKPNACAHNKPTGRRMEISCRRRRKPPKATRRRRKVLVSQRKHLLCRQTQMRRAASSSRRASAEKNTHANKSIDRRDGHVRPARRRRRQLLPDRRGQTKRAQQWKQNACVCVAERNIYNIERARKINVGGGRRFCCGAFLLFLPRLLQRRRLLLARLCEKQFAAARETRRRSPKVVRRSRSIETTFEVLLCARARQQFKSARRRTHSHRPFAGKGLPAAAAPRSRDSSFGTASGGAHNAANQRRGLCAGEQWRRRE